MNTAETCLIWGTEAEIQNSPEKQELVVDSPRTGGKYCVTVEAKELLKGLDDSKKARMTSWLIKQRSLGVECPKIEKKTISNEEYGQALTFQEKATQFLGLLKLKSPTLGKAVKLNAINRNLNNPDYANHLEMLAWSESINQNELYRLQTYTKKHGWIEGSIDPHVPILILTVDGHIHLEKLKKAAQNSSQAFVAMWFDESMSEAWEEGIKPAIRNSGYEPFRVDEAEETGRIDDRIIAEIRRSRFIVADFTHGETGARGGVYYEAGFAHGLEITVIFTCRKDLIEKITAVPTF